MRDLPIFCAFGYYKVIERVKRKVRKWLAGSKTGCNVMIFLRFLAKFDPSCVS